MSSCLPSFFRTIRPGTGGERHLCAFLLYILAKIASFQCAELEGRSWNPTLLATSPSYCDGALTAPLGSVAATTTSSFPYASLTALQVGILARWYGPPTGDWHLARLCCGLESGGIYLLQQNQSTWAPAQKTRALTWARSSPSSRGRGPTSGCARPLLSSRAASACCRSQTWSLPPCLWAEHSQASPAQCYSLSASVAVRRRGPGAPDAWQCPAKARRSDAAG